MQSSTMKSIFNYSYTWRELWNNCRTIWRERSIFSPYNPPRRTLKALNQHKCSPGGRLDGPIVTLSSTSLWKNWQTTQLKVIICGGDLPMRMVVRYKLHIFKPPGVQPPSLNRFMTCNHISMPPRRLIIYPPTYNQPCLVFQWQMRINGDH